MYRTPFPKILVFSLIWILSLYWGLSGQKKAADEVDMTMCWSYSQSESVAEQIVSNGSRVFLALDGAKVEALGLAGKKIWSAEFGGEISSNMLAADAGLYLVTSTAEDSDKQANNRLRSVSKETGITNWTLTLPDAPKYWLGNSNRLLVIVSENGVVQWVDAKSGNVKWKREIAEGFVAEPIFAANYVAVSTRAHQIFVISTAAGEIKSVRKVPFRITSLANTEDGDLIAGDERGNVTWINGTGKPSWTFKAGGEISNIIAAGDHILVTSHDNFVYFLRNGNGGRIWKMRLSGRAAGITTYADSFALISTADEHRAVVVNLESGKIAGQALFDDDETLVQIRPLGGQFISLLTNKALKAYSLSGCPSK